MQKFAASNLKKQGLLYLGLAFFLFIFFKNAWVADDAYIAFRSVEQMFAGNGPRWNIDERVQVYTSPLWFALLLLTRIISDNLFLSAILLSAACCTAALLLVRKTLNNDMRWLAFVLLVSGVWGIMDFSSSGLENPLLYFLISIFTCYYFSFFQSTTIADKKYNLSVLMASIGLISITRHDISTLIFIPATYLLYVFCHQAGWKQAVIFIGQKSYLVLAPLLLWTLFSVVYYGAPFPNTAYAKMLHGIPRQALVDFGWLYLKVSVMFDLFAQLILLGLVARVLWKREASCIFILAGVMLNFFYVVYVGGDFMQGRFISEALFMAAIALFAPCVQPQPSQSHLFKYTSAGIVVCLLALMLYMSSPLTLRPDSGFDIDEGRRHYSWRGILNERNFYFKTNSLWAYLHRDETRTFPNHKWCNMGENAAAEHKEVSGFGGIGMYGYCAGLELIVMDNLALAEPFLARLPKMPERRGWRAGHFRRDYPQGYQLSRVSGQNQLVDPHLARLWDDVVQLTRAPIFTVERWKAIWRVNSGFYNDIGHYYHADIMQNLKAQGLDELHD